MLIGHTLRYLPAQLLSPLAQLVSVILWTHWLAPQEMGVFTLVTVTQEIAYLACLGWFAIYALRYLPPPGDGAALQRYLGTENSVVLASVGLSAVVAAATWFTLPGQQPFWASTLTLTLFFATKAVNAHYAERARAQSAFLAYSLLQVVGPVGGLALGWLLLHQQAPPSALLLLGAYAAAQALGTALALPGLGMQWRLQRPDWPLLRTAARFGGPVLMLSALGWVAENYIRYLVQWHSGATALGLMIVGWSLGRRCAAVASTLVTTAAFPLAARLLNDNRRDEALRQLALNAALMLGVLLPITAALQVLGPTLVALCVAPQYQQVTGELMGLAVLGGAVRNLHMHTTDQLMVLERRIRMVAQIDLVEIVLCAAASLAGLAWDGLRGALIGQALGSLAALALSLAWAQGRLGLRWPWLASAKLAAATALMLLALARLNPAHDALGLALGTVTGGLVYLGACALAFAPALHRLWRERRPRPDRQAR
jgi:O-antigen/teichoic acid export membrane protein